MQLAGVETIKRDVSQNVKSSLFIVFKCFQQKNFCLKTTIETRIIELQLRKFPLLYHDRVQRVCLLLQTVLCQN